MGKMEFCFECDEFPCVRVAHLDKRYRTRYGLSVIDNLINIQNLGVDWFVNSENMKWACPNCGEIVSMHKPLCPGCGVEWRKFAANR
jgi:rubrerythrin